MFFIAYGLMNETHTIATKETEKMAIKEQFCPNLSPLAIATAHPGFCTQCPPLELNYSLKSLSRSRPSFVSFSPPGATFFLSQSSYPSSTSLCRRFAPSKPIYSQSLAHYIHSHQSWFRFTAERRGISFWLHIICNVETQMKIARYFSSVILYF